MKFDTLLVDDDEIILFLHHKILTTTNIHPSPITFTSGEDLINYLKNKTESNKIKLILLDINMPHYNAWEILDIIEKENFQFDIRIILVTSSVDDLDKQKANSYKNVIYFIEKPMTKKTAEALKSNQHLSDLFS